LLTNFRLKAVLRTKNLKATILDQGWWPFALIVVRDHHPLLRSRIIPTTTKPSRDVLESCFNTPNSLDGFIIVETRDDVAD